MEGIGFDGGVEKNRRMGGGGWCGAPPAPIPPHYGKPWIFVANTH